VLQKLAMWQKSTTSQRSCELSGSQRISSQREASQRRSLEDQLRGVEDDKVNFGDSGHDKETYRYDDMFADWWDWTTKGPEYSGVADTPWRSDGAPLPYLEAFCRFLVDVNVRPELLTVVKVPVAVVWVSGGMWTCVAGCLCALWASWAGGGGRHRCGDMYCDWKCHKD
jgi:hypothetical protein